MKKILIVAMLCMALVATMAPAAAAADTNYAQIGRASCRERV